MVTQHQGGKKKGEAIEKTKIWPEAGLTSSEMAWGEQGKRVQTEVEGNKTRKNRKVS